MKDRISTYPNRVRLVPVTGQDNVFDLVRADEPIEDGTPLNKANLLADDTASLLGLDSTATLDDFLKNVMLGGFKGFWWKKYDSSVTFETTSPETVTFFSSVSSSATIVIYYSDSYTVSENGFTLPNKQSVTLVPYQTNEFEVLKGKYYALSDLSIYSSINKISASSVATSIYNYGNTYSFYASDIETYQNASISHSLIDYVCSSDINAYPNGDYADDGYYYKLDKSVCVENVYRWDKYIREVQLTRTKNYASTLSRGSPDYDTNSGTGNSYGGNSEAYFYYADSYETYTENEVTYFRLINPVKSTTQSTHSEIVGKYSVGPVSSTEKSRYLYRWGSLNGAYIPMFAYSNDFGTYSLTAFYYEIFVASVEKTLIKTVTSLESNAYPNKDYADDGFYYDSREEITLGGAKVASGSYVGTGEYGTSSNESIVGGNSLTFNFTPKLVCVHQDQGQARLWMLNPSTRAVAFTNGNSTAPNIVDWGKNSVSWYSTSNANGQLNYTATKYNYIAIG